jgi:drug/metabolite transporter (DMT)-like permease
MNNQPVLLARPITIFILLLCAVLFASNHIAARIAFDNGTGLLLAVLARGGMALLLMMTIVVIRKAPLKIPPPLIKWQIFLGLLIAVQSVCLYSAIIRIPVALALLLVNTWPVMFIVLSWMKGKKDPNTLTLLILSLILFGLFFVLDIDLSVKLEAKWILGVGLGFLSAVLLTIAMWITQYQLGQVPGSVRSSYTMLIVITCMVLLGSMGVIPGGIELPVNTNGWLGLLGLAVFYGVASTLLFVLAHKLDMGRNSPILNFEPVASLFLGYVFLGQFLNTMQLVGGSMVVGGIIAIGMMRK